MNPFLISVTVVALAEIGDKTQLLSLLLAARFRKPVPIILGIFVATIFNHALAGLVGEWISRTVAICVLSPISARKNETRLMKNTLPWLRFASSSSSLSGFNVHAAMTRNEMPTPQRMTFGPTARLIHSPTRPASA